MGNGVEFRPDRRNLPFRTTVFRSGQQFGWARIAMRLRMEPLVTRADTEGGFETRPYGSMACNAICAVGYEPGPRSIE